MASGVRQSARRRRKSETTIARRFKYWPVAALLPVIIVGQVKATGFVSIGGVDTTVLSLFILLVATGVTFLNDRQYPVRKMLPYILLAMVVMLAVARSEAGTYQALKVRDFFLVTGVIVLCLPILLRCWQDLRGFVMVWFAGGVLVATLVFTVGGADDLLGRAGIGEATLGPAYLTAAAVVVGAASLGEKLLPASVALPGMVISGIALVSIGSRGPVIATVVGLLVWMLLRGLFRARTVAVSLLVGGIALVAVNQATEAALARFVFEDENRQQLWVTARLVFLEAPFFGVGWGDFTNYSTLDEYPHNLFLEAASELGLLGIVSVLGLLGVASVRVWRCRTQPEVRIVAALATAMLVGQSFSSDLTNRLFWIALIPCLLIPLDGAQQEASRSQ